MTCGLAYAKLHAVRRIFTARTWLLFGMSVGLESFVAVTWLPGPSPIDGNGWPVLVIVVCFAICVCAMAPLIEDRKSKKSLRGRSFLGRDLPRRVRLTGGLLIAAALFAQILGLFDGGGVLESPRRSGDRYYANNVTLSPRVDVEIPRSRYEFEIEEDQRAMLGVGGLLCAWFTWVDLTQRPTRPRKAASRRSPY